MRRTAFAIAFTVALASCANDDPEPTTGSAVEHGRALFADPKTSSSPSNVFACSTCHVVDAADPARIRPGYALAGVTARTTYWGGQRVDLLEAIDDCRLSFMDAPRPWTKDDEDARAIYAYLSSVSASGAAQTFDVEPRDPPVSNDKARGESVYAKACALCHGKLRDGAGRLVSFAPVLPLAPPADRTLYVRRVRRGRFASASGSMPPFSHEALSDEDLSALLAYLGY